MPTVLDPTNVNFVVKDILYQEILVLNLQSHLPVLKVIAFLVIQMEHVIHVSLDTVCIMEFVSVTSKIV